MRRSFSPASARSRSPSMAARTVRTLAQLRPRLARGQQSLGSSSGLDRLDPQGRVATGRQSSLLPLRSGEVEGLVDLDARRLGDSYPIAGHPDPSAGREQPGGEHRGGQGDSQAPAFPLLGGAGLSLGCAARPPSAAAPHP